MLLGVDHLVIAVRDLPTAMRGYERLGFSVVPGGRHPTGTHNALIAFADGSYLELIAFTERRPDHRWWAPLEAGGGLVDFCFATSDLTADVNAFRAAGVAISDRRPLSRLRPDGFEVRWALAIPDSAFRGQAPFLIEDETSRQERVPREPGHANGVTGIANVTVAIPDAAVCEQWYARVLGAPGRRIACADLEGNGVRFMIGRHAFEFVAPSRPRGPLSAWLTTRGPSPYAATLTTTGVPGPLEAGLTEGAQLTAVHA